MNKKFITTFIFIFFFFNFFTLTTLSISDIEVDSCIDSRATIKYHKKEHYKTLSTVSMLLERQCEGKTEVLLQLRKNTGWMDGFWDFGACGHVDDGETLTDAAIRETKEELCVDVLPEDIEFLSLNHNNLGNKGIYYCFYIKVKKYRGEIKIGEPEKCAELKWFDIENLPKNIIPIRKYSLEDYKKGIIYNEIGWDKRETLSNYNIPYPKRFG